jgi:peptidyl-prolyl cis-trans isomerase D
VRQIVTADEATARRARHALTQGRPFTDVAKEIAGMDEETTQLGFVTADRLPGEIGRTAFSATLDRPSEPFASPLGWHIVLVERIEHGKTPTLDDVRADIRLDLGRERAVDGLVTLANQLEDALAGGATIDEAARQINARTSKTPPIDARGRTANGKPAIGLPKDEEFLRTAFEVEDGQVSDLIETRTGGYLIVRVDAVTAPAVRPFDSVRQPAVTAWKLDQQDQAAKKKAAELLDKIKAGGSLTTVAKAAALKVQRSKPFTRVSRAAGSRIPPALARDLFALRPGQAAMGRNRQGYAVAQLVDIQAASPSSDNEGLKGLRNRLHSAVAEDVMAQYAAALRNRYTVSIDRGAIDRLFNEGTLGQY